MKEKPLYRFLNWWKDAPAWQTVWVTPIVLVMYIFAVIKNSITEKIKK